MSARVNPSALPSPPGASRRGRKPQLLKAGEGFAQPDVWIVDDGVGNLLVWKTWGRRPAWERHTLGRLLARREAHALARLGHLSALPELIGRPHPWTVAMELLEGDSLPRDRETVRVPGDFFDRLWTTVEAIHRAGFNHGDLRAKNILCARTESREPLLLDFTQSIDWRSIWWAPLRPLRETAFRTDRLKFLQLKKRLCETPLSAEEEAELEVQPHFFRLGHWLRAKVYRPFKHWRRGEG